MITVPAAAEEICVKDGKKLNGVIVASEENMFKVKTDFGYVLVDKDKISSIIPNTPGETSGKNGSTCEPGFGVRVTSHPRIGTKQSIQQLHERFSHAGSASTTRATLPNAIVAMGASLRVVGGEKTQASLETAASGVEGRLGQRVRELPANGPKDRVTSCRGSLSRIRRPGILDIGGHLRWNQNVHGLNNMP